MQSGSEEVRLNRGTVPSSPMSTKKENNVVFIGNIPFDQTEESLKDVFSQVGPIVTFRLIFDPETNRPKGFAFCEYPDVATAATAVRNLNGYEIGTRQLRVDFSGKESVSNGPSADPDRKAINTLPTLRETQAPLAGVTIPSAISQILQTYTPQQLTEIISQLKAVSTHNPELARQLLTSQPQLTYAVFQALLMMNLVDASVLQHVISSTGQSAPGPPATHPGPSVPPTVDPQRLALIQQVMSLTDTQISALPPDQRAQIIALRHQVMTGQL